MGPGHRTRKRARANLREPPTLSAVGLRDYTRPLQPKSVRVYKPDGTVLQTIPSRGATPSIAISPNGKFVAIVAGRIDHDGGVTVFSVDDGTIIGAHTFATETFCPGPDQGGRRAFRAGARARISATTRPLWRRLR